MNRCFASLLLVVSTLVLSNTSSAQTEAYSFSPAPSASGIGNAVSNNLFDGSANINIPIYSTAIDGVPVNVFLGYNTRGIKVDQVASSAGLGWDVYSGPYITRKVKDLPDEVYVPRHTIKGSSSTWWNQVENGFWFDYYDPDNWKVEDDNEMDEFNLVLGNRSVRFQISRNGTVVTFPKSNIKIERIIDQNIVGNVRLAGDMDIMNPNNLPHQLILEFQVTDEMGNKYKFKRGDVHYKKIATYEDTSIAYNDGPSQGWYYDRCYFEVTDRWVIEKITTYSGREISYTYATSNINLVTNLIENTDESAGYVPIPNHRFNHYDGWISYPTLISPSNGNIITFNYNSYQRYDVPGGKILDNVDIMDYYEPLANNPSSAWLSHELKYKLNQSYFHSYESTNSALELALSYPSTHSVPEFSLRLKLNSIDKVAGNNTEPFYSFTYYDDGTYRMPFRLSPSQDNYGFYNGASVQAWGAHHHVPLVYSGVTKHDFDGEDVGIYRGSNVDYAIAYDLSLIKNGTGGSTAFAYEQNHLTPAAPSYMSGIQSGAYTSYDPIYEDGVRLQNQFFTDGYNPSNDFREEYFYHDAGSTTGQIFMPGGVSYYSITKYGTTHYIWFNTFINAICRFNNSNHGYPIVSVTKKRAPNGIPAGLISSTDYYFTTLTDNYSGYITGAANGIHVPNNVNSEPANLFNLHYDVLPFTDKQYFKELLIGLPVKTIQYDQNNNPISSVENYYTWNEDYKSASEFSSTKYIQNVYDGSLAFSNYVRDIYYPNTGTVLLNKTVNKRFITNSNPVVTTTTYQYDSRNNPSIIGTTSNTGLDNTTHNYYSYDWIGNPSVSSAIAQLNSNSVQVPILTEKWKGTGSNATLLSAQVSSLGIFNGKVRPKNTYVLNAGNGLSLSAYGGGPSAINLSVMEAGYSVYNFRKVNTANYYDVYGNMMDVTGADDNSNAFIYDGTHNRVIAKISNAPISDVAYTSFDGTYQALGSADDNKGNWNFDPLYVKTASSQSFQPLSGNFIYTLPVNNSGASINSVNALTTGKRYILSFWTKGGMPDVQESGYPVSMTAMSIARGTWTGWRAEFVSHGGTVTIAPSSSSNVYLDEVRLYPYGATMSTQAYEPLFGVKSTCDENDRFTFYDFDDFGNQVATYDHGGRLLVKKKYVVQGQD